VGVTSLQFGLDGTLYGGTRNGDFLRIDPATAVFTLVGPSGTSPLAGLGVRDECGAACRPPLNLFATDGSAGNLLTVDTVTGIATTIGFMGLAAPSLAVDPGTGVLYAGEGNGLGLDNLYTVDPVTATPNLVGNSGLGAWAIAGMDFDSGGALYASINMNGPGQGGGDVLGTLNKNTGAGAIIGPFGPTDISAIAFEAAGTLYGVSSGAAGPPTLYTINTSTGAATAVAQILDQFGVAPAGRVGSLDYDLSGFLYAGTTQGFGDLLRIDPATATFSLVGNSGFPLLASLAFQETCAAVCDPPTTLYASDGSGGNLNTIDQVTAAATFIGGMTIPAPSLAFDPVTGGLYAGTGGGLDDLWWVEKSSGSARRIGPTTLGVHGIVGMSFDAGGNLWASISTGAGGQGGGDTLARLHKTTGLGIPVGLFGLTDMSALAFNQAGTLYGVSSGAAGPPSLYTINLTTGAATLIGPLLDRFGAPPVTRVSGLEFDPGGILFGGLANGDVIRIDPLTATFNTLGNTTLPVVAGLALDESCPRLDCDPSDLSVWTVPGEVRNLIATSKTTFVWDPPLKPGGTSVIYDVLRSPFRNTFASPNGMCVEINDTDRTFTDAAAVANIFYYVVRAEHKCGQGTIGFRWDGTPRPSRSCP
jgi:hypothetical protein